MSNAITLATLEALPKHVAGKMYWLGSRNVLHHIAEPLTKSQTRACWNEGRISLKTTCGVTCWLDMPGLHWRFSAPRCGHCCRRLGVPRGHGVPENEAYLRRDHPEDYDA